MGRKIIIILIEGAAMFHIVLDCECEKSKQKNDKYNFNGETL